MLGLVHGEGNNSETAAEKIERLEAEIEELKSDLENERQRGDEHYDEQFNLREELARYRKYVSDEDLDRMETMYDEGIELSDLLDDRGKINSGELVEPNDEEFEAAETVRSLKQSYERLNMGVLSEIDEIIKLTNDLLEMHL